jgi:hypothetical protein
MIGNHDVDIHKYQLINLFLILFDEVNKVMLKEYLLLEQYVVLIIMVQLSNLLIFLLLNLEQN